MGSAVPGQRTSLTETAVPLSRPFFWTRVGSMEFVWNIDPDLFYIESWGRGIRYYGVLYAIALMGGFYFWRWQMLRGGYSEERTDGFLTPAVIATIAGARIGHCVFYDWDRYSQDPITILYFWQGGLSSHGSTIAILLALWWFSRREGTRFMEMGDRFALSVAWAATLIRLGNFMNSEIVGRIAKQGEGIILVKFPRYELSHGVLRRGVLDDSQRFCAQACEIAPVDTCVKIKEACYSLANVPWRHATQLYEALIGISILAMILVVDRVVGEERRPVGLLFGLFVMPYFIGRFLIEYAKEYQTGLTAGLTRGQELSIPFILVGLGFIVYALTKGPRGPDPKVLAEKAERDAEAKAEG